MAWASISTSFPSICKNLKFTSWRYSEGWRYERPMVKDVWRKPGRVTLCVNNSKAEFRKSQFVTYVASEGQSSESELNLESLELEPETLNHVAEDDSPSSSSHFLSGRTAGKPGFISFHGLPCQRQEEILETSTGKERSKVFWFVGPSVLVAFLVLPSLYLRRILSTVLEDSLLTDFLILFFTEVLFYGGVAIFLLMVDHIWRPLQQNQPSNKDLTKFHFGLRISSVATLVLSLIIPLLTMGMVWPWTGPAASATLAPYLVGLIVQFAFERYTRYQKSPAWPVVPVIFQVYRLHQLNRAAQLVTALSFSVRGAETTSQTLAINSSLGTLLTVLQILGIICIWSLSSFLMRFIPSSQAIPES
ncbi:uncharacterized protein A4U43_C01F3660 [Asparagus officinalis]|uniref:Uncharacterized protein n=1 Tax=Asparagus officinalis TaxID=4686 RepID=A0A5P1FM17_ASPOF|nr:uncharacterized protein LOC109847659 [Asparagus officinalis]ONK79172.1 uncharacterized protein A4U43_C01F3660 [Asparagus officinalis]